MKCDSEICRSRLGEGAPLCLKIVLVLATSLSVSGVLATASQMDDPAQQTKGKPAAGYISLVAKATEYSKWTIVKNSSTTIVAGPRPVILSLIPISGTMDMPYRIRLDSPKGGITNRWELRYLRDSKIPVAAFAVGQATPSHALIIEVPVTLTALDTPPAGTHTYVLQVRYVGSQNEGVNPKLEIQNARISANTL